MCMNNGQASKRENRERYIEGDVFSFTLFLLRTSKFSTEFCLKVLTSVFLCIIIVEQLETGNISIVYNGIN
jgi:hypothetical protein